LSPFISGTALGELQEPPAVTDATAEYRTEMDTIARFLDECCVVIDNRKLPGVKASALASAYLGWCKRTGELPMPNRTFIKDLEDRQYTRERGTGNHYYWYGLGLVNTDDEHYSPQ
jgi:putative DNA primase/helicase